jgi:hypothetical protein
MMYEYLAEQYERQAKLPPKPITYWILAFAIWMIVGLVLATALTKSARNVAIDRMNFHSCYSTGC